MSENDVWTLVFGLIFVTGGVFMIWMGFKLLNSLP